LQIGNNIFDSILYSPATENSRRHQLTAESTLQAAKSAVDMAPTAEFDLYSISPREIDLLIKTLRGQGAISDNQVFQLRKYGADFLSSQPDQSWSTEMLDQKQDLAGKLEQQIADEKAVGNPVQIHEYMLEFIRELEARNHMPVAGVIV
jgi:hypothetical protein